jgi:hypothetical protein
MAVDGEGTVWTLVADAITDGYLFKLDPGIGIILERHVLPGRKSARYLSYDPASNSLIVEENDAAGVLRFSLDSLSIDATLSQTLNATVDNRAQYSAGPVDGRLWLQSSENVAYEIDTRTFTVLRSASKSLWAGVPSVEQMVYDAVEHALIWLDVLPTPTLYWLYLDRKAGLGVPLKDIVGDLSARVGLNAADLKTMALSDSVIGFAVTDRMSARAALEPLAAAFLFDAREEDFKIDFVVRGGAPLLTLPQDDLGARSDEDDGFVPPVREHRTQEIELPGRIDMTYADPESDFQTGVQSFQRIGEAVDTRKRVTLNVPIAFTRNEAAQRVERIGYLAWQSRSAFGLSLSRKHARLSPGDVIQVNAQGALFTMRIDRIDLGADGVIQVHGVAENAALYTSTASGVAALAVPDQVVTLSGPSALYLMDTPLLRDADDGLGIYIAAGSYGSANWHGASIFKSTDGLEFATPVTFVSAGRNAVHGRTETVLPTHGARTWDRTNTVKVRLFRGALSSATETAVLNGANAMLIGDEVIQFANAILNQDGSYTLSVLLRGRRGTEWATGGHAAGERAIALTDAALLRTTLADAELNALRFYKAVTVGGTLAEGTRKSLTFLGRSFMPYAPVHVTGSVSGSPADWIIAWVRRSRLGGAWKDGADIPLGEESEAYEVDVLNGGAVVRTITATPSAGGSVAIPSNRQATYSAADQIADFGGEQAILTVRIYQISTSVGRGFPAQAVLAA